MKIEELIKHSDHRGDLVVFVDKEIKICPEGKIYYVTFNKKGVVRGNHYHKKIGEWFMCIQGEIVCRTKDKNGQRSIVFLPTVKSTITRIYIPPLVTHCFESITESAILLNYTTGRWSKKDTYADKIN